MCSPTVPSTPATRSRCERLAARAERGSFALALSAVPLAALVHPGAALVPCAVLVATLILGR